MLCFFVCGAGAEGYIAFKGVLFFWGKGSYRLHRV